MKKSFIFIAVLLAVSFSSVYSQTSLGKLRKAASDVVSGKNETVNKIMSVADSVKAADSLTTENEYYMGRAVAANIAAKYPVIKNAANDKYYNSILDAIVFNSPMPYLYNGYHLAVLDTDEINAFSTPGGHIFITRGLIGCARSEDALAGVIAHEVAHIQKRHALTSIRNARYVNLAVSGTLSGLEKSTGAVDIKELADVMGESVNEMITTLTVNGFSPSQEFEADATALSLLASAGYQPSEYLEMLQILKQRQQGKAGFGSTHPSPDDRIANANKTLKKYKVEDTRSFRAGRYGDISK